MILDEIAIHDFGVYEGIQRIALTPESEEKPIVLIGGLNGGGKTTFLDALQLVLFGAHAKCSNRGSLAYNEYLDRCIHRHPDKDEAGIEISFRRTVEGVEEQYRLHRSWRRQFNGCVESFEVFRDGKPEAALADNWASQVEDFFPANIAHLFLFDGELVEAYASQRDSAALIGSAIQNLLGLDMVDQLERDLQVYERRTRAQGEDDSKCGEIAVEQDNIRGLRDKSDELQQAQAALRTHQIDRLTRKLEDKNAEYRKIGGELYDQREALESSHIEAQSKTSAGELALREHASGTAPLILLRRSLEKLEGRDELEEKCRRSNDYADLLVERDKATLSQARELGADKNVVDALRKYLESDQSLRRQVGNETPVLNLNREVRSELHFLLRSGLDDAQATAKDLLIAQGALRAREEQARVEHENIPGADTIDDLARERDEIRAELKRTEIQHADRSDEIERLRRELERRSASLTRLLEADAKGRQRLDDRTRILRHSTKARATLEAFRKSVITRHIERIEQHVLESYQQLLRKGGLVTRLSINPENYALTLFGRNDKVLSSERLSAGERQLLAIALLWGLAKASGRPLPMAIDTPLGRLDSVHRMHLIERYLPFASHQILLLSTDEEIMGEYLQRLLPWIGHTYLLTHDDSSGASRMTKGYLKAREAA